MISCVSLDRICTALTKAFGDIGASFGGKSVILAGDFAQLPPPGNGFSLYSGGIGMSTKSSSNYVQRAVIGKAQWHTFTTVVILRENMRQKGMDASDVAFRTALVNMRYGRCTSDDVLLLRSRVYHPTRPSPVDSLDGFEEVSIITARNSHRDAINRDASRLFAERHGKVLHHFHSIDKWGRVKNSESIREAQRLYKATVDPVRRSDVIQPELQRVLWKLLPELTKHHAGVLSLCEGMPVVIKNNEATELGITNGATGFVAGWKSHSDAVGREYLDVLFVRLDRPRRDVHLPGLPVNVVPLTRLTKSTQCTLPINDLIISIQRGQVSCLQNFAITDYGCQGQTRYRNVIHPRHSHDHLSMYTMLSRSSSLKDTIILEGFDASKIQRGASAALIREY
ncbi:hypothetical protein FKP32DRAFT_1538555, partial [Trametes sanguinea]